MDGLMCEDIRVGIQVRMELDDSRFFWRRKDVHSGVGMSFSSSLIEHAGGIRKLIEEWEQLPWETAK